MVQEFSLDDTRWYHLALILCAIGLGLLWGLRTLYAVVILVHSRLFRYRNLPAFIVGAFLVLCCTFIFWTVVSLDHISRIKINSEGIRIHKGYFASARELKWQDILSVSVKGGKRGWREWEAIVIVEKSKSRHVGASCKTPLQRARLHEAIAVIEAIHPEVVKHAKHEL